MKVSKMFTLMCSFWAKYILVELKKYIGVIFHDTEEWYKICRGINVSFQNWHEEFGRFWPEHLKVSKIFTLMGSFWTKYILFELKRYRGFIFHDTEEWSKTWRKTDLWFGKWHGEFGKFSPDHLKVSKFGRWWDPFVKSRKRLSLKFTRQWRMMQNLKRNWLDISKLTGIWRILTLTLWKSETYALKSDPLTTVYNVWAKKSTDELYLMAVKIDAKFEGKLTCACQKWHEELVNLHRLKQMNSTFNKTFYACLTELLFLRYK